MKEERREKIEMQVKDILKGGDIKDEKLWQGMRKMKKD